MNKLKTTRGTIFILTLWGLSFLSVLVIVLASGMRQKLNVLAHIERRDSLRLIASSGVYKTIALLNKIFAEDSFVYTPQTKMTLHYNPKNFESISLRDGTFQIRYSPDDGRAGQIGYGVVDEESKLNLNTVELGVLQDLIIKILPYDKEKSSELARAILDWRQEDDSELVGFYSQDYYENLEFPYPIKNTPYEFMEELLLIKGMDERTFNAVKNYLTIYGDGKVNINTASPVVLSALGLGDELTKKILSLRYGPDRMEGTEDDYIFHQADAIAGEVHRHVKLSRPEIEKILDVVAAGKLGVDSGVYTIVSRARLNQRDASHTVCCVYNVPKGKIEYWSELN